MDLLVDAGWVVVFPAVAVVVDCIVVDVGERRLGLSRVGVCVVAAAAGLSWAGGWVVAAAVGCWVVAAAAAAAGC